MNANRAALCRCSSAGAALLGIVCSGGDRVWAHKDPTTAEQLKAFEDAFMEAGHDRRSAVPWRPGDREEDWR